jgi:hypothetical protein
MRIWIALVLFVGGLVAGSIGVVNQLENQPLDRIIATGTLVEPTTYVFIPSKVLSSYPAPVSVESLGPRVFLATGRDVDIEAWLGDSPFVEIGLQIDQDAKRALLVEKVRTGSGVLSDPTGSDLWRSEVTGEAGAKLAAQLDGETGVLLASNGIEEAPRALSIIWDLPDEPGPIAPITFIGIGLLLAGSALALWDAKDYWKKRRRKIVGPKPPRRRSPRKAVSQAGEPPRRGRRARLAMVSATAVLLSLLSGCVPDYQSPIVSPSPLPAPERLTPAVSVGQGERILQEILGVVQQSDETLNRETLETRLSGPALEVRKFEYNLVRRYTDVERDPLPLQDQPVQLFLPPATDTWPRNMLFVTGEENLQLFILQQLSPREKYTLYFYANLLPGSDFPEVASELVGANQLKPDNKFLKVSPDVLAVAVGDLLNLGSESSWSLVLDPNNDYIRDVSSVQQGLVDTLTNANLSFDHQLSDQQPVLMSTVDGGALVAIYMVDTYRIIPKSRGDAVAISGDEAILLGSGGSASGIETRYGAMLLFYVPAAGSDQRITLLGATQQLLTAAAVED